jgi:hypothetical protein
MKSPTGSPRRPDGKVSKLRISQTAVEANLVRFVQSHEVASSLIEEEILTLNLESGEYVGMSDVAAFVWTHLSEPTTASELAEKVAAEFDVDGATAAEDVNAFLEELAKEGLVVEVPEAG